MDIFTTQLTRVVPVTIKPEKLKVKALVKEANIREFEEELDHLDGHEQTVEKPKYKHKDSDQQSAKDNKETELDNVIPDASSESSIRQDKGDDDEEVHHLDIYV